MTGRLNFVLQFRDAQVAEDVRKKAELGWFDMEFTMYGTAYLDGGELCYKVSSDAGKIYSFIEQASRKQLFCSNVLTLTRTCAVPMGMKDDMALTVKKELACQLRKAYPQELFLLLGELAAEIRSDAAYPWLMTKREALEGVFDDRRLRHFQTLLQYCYSCQKLSEAHYQSLMAWVRREYQCMLDGFVSKDLFEKHFYGFAYASGSSYRYLQDSLPEYIYQRKFALEEQGIFTSPVLSETLWYNYTYSLADCRRDYEKLLKTALNEPDLQSLNAIMSSAAELTLAGAYHRALEDMGEIAAATFNRHLGRWGLRPLL